MPALLVSDVMTRYVEFLDPDASAQDAAILMGDLDVGCLPIGDASAIEGVVTDRDILYRLVATGLDPATKIRRIMSEPVIGCAENDTVRAALDTMAANHIRRMPVFDDKRAVTGWITLADLSRTLLVESTVLQTALRGMTEADA